MEPITASVITGVVISVISGIVLGIMKRKWQKTDRKEEIKLNRETEEIKQIREMQKSIWRLNKTVLIMAKIIDDQTAKVHSELSSSLEDIASELLGESSKS